LWESKNFLAEHAEHAEQKGIGSESDFLSGPFVSFLLSVLGVLRERFLLCAGIDSETIGALRSRVAIGHRWRIERECRSGTMQMSCEHHG